MEGRTTVRNGFVTAVPVTGTPFPAEVRERANELRRAGWPEVEIQVIDDGEVYKISASAPTGYLSEVLYSRADGTFSARDEDLIDI